MKSPKFKTMNQKLFSYNSNSSKEKITRSFYYPNWCKLCNERMVTLRKRGKKKKQCTKKQKSKELRLSLIEYLMAGFVTNITT